MSQPGAVSRPCWHETPAHSPGYLLYGVLYARDGEEGCEVGCVGGDDDESEHPPDAHHHPSGQSGIRHFSAWKTENTDKKKALNAQQQEINAPQ